MNFGRRTFLAAWAGAVAALERFGCAAEDELPTSRLPISSPLSHTAGGKQFWGDEFFFHRWKIQRNILTGHFRLLDPDNIRLAFGTMSHCQEVLHDFKVKKKLPPMSGTGVILMHGLLRSSASMDSLAEYLTSHGQMSVFNVTYPSTRASLEQHARQLDRVIRTLEGIDKIHFVAHSLGNLVTRRWMTGFDNASPHVPDRRLGRMVMLGPPNNGAELATFLGQNKLVEVLAGEPVKEMGRKWEDVQARLATPPCEFGIIAGGRNAGRGYNPLLEGDNDFLVTVDSARLPGAADMAVVPIIHALLMDDPVAQVYTLRFLRQGYFIDAEHRQPIERVAQKVGS